MGFMVEDRHLYAGFVAAMAEEPKITPISGQAVVAQQVTGQSAQVSLASGRTLTARVLVGCDGRTSGVAQRAGIARHGHAQIKNFSPAGGVSQVKWLQFVTHHGIKTKTFNKYQLTTLRQIIRDQRRYTVAER